MDDTQHFCLRWNNYQSSITSAFENLRDDEAFVDVTLACEGRSIKAHRVVLSACSPYFRELLKSTPCPHPVILLQDVNFMDLHSLVEFIYHGEVHVHQKSLPFLSSRQPKCCVCQDSSNIKHRKPIASQHNNCSSPVILPCPHKVSPSISLFFVLLLFRSICAQKLIITFFTSNAKNTKKKKK
ncbi:GL14266 [Drosophila persimilis]|uniref:GL14266 n=1 Tax=Drosophila persimilis TaxID=7234 RepID=B4GTJ5_DROPE|nr:GL14266 [Drosophila persimilis]